MNGDDIELALVMIGILAAAIMIAAVVLWFIEAFWL